MCVRCLYAICIIKKNIDADMPTILEIAFLNQFFASTFICRSIFFQLSAVCQGEGSRHNLENT